jgi:hypothetical protein
VVKKLDHHNAFSEAFCGHGNLMDFSRLPVSSAVHVACSVSVLADGNIAGFVVCEV